MPIALVIKALMMTLGAHGNHRELVKAGAVVTSKAIIGANPNKAITRLHHIVGSRRVQTIAIIINSLQIAKLVQGVALGRLHPYAALEQHKHQKGEHYP